MSEIKKRIIDIGELIGNSRSNRGDIPVPAEGHSKTAVIAPTSTGTGLLQQEKAPRDLRDRTFIVVEEDKTIPPSQS